MIRFPILDKGSVEVPGTVTLLYDVLYDVKLTSTNANLLSISGAPS